MTQNDAVYTSACQPRIVFPLTVDVWWAASAAGYTFVVCWTKLLLRGYTVHYVSTNYANSAFDPPGVGKWVVIHVFTFMMEEETIKKAD